MKSDRGRLPTFDPRTRKYFARLIGKHGLRGAAVASKVPVSVATLAKVANEFGIQLKAGRRRLDESPVSKPKLTELQVQQLQHILARGAVASGYRSDHWTGRRISEVVHKLFAVKCHATHLKPILSNLGFQLVERSVITIRRDTSVAVLSPPGPPSGLSDAA
jgi:transposase